MAQIRITQYIHRPNKTELGIGNTHECYLLVGSDIDMSGIFPPAQDVVIHDAMSKKEYVLKSSYYREFRINQMGEIYRDYNVQPGDEIIISEVKKEELSDLSFSVRRYNRIVLLVKKGIAEINNVERLKPFERGNRKYALDIVDRGNKSKLLISFQESMPKRSDSPVMTDYYNVNIDGERMANGTYYITISDDKNIIANLPKSDFNSIVFDDKTIDSMKTTKIKTNKLTDPLQQIYYGAPGTGKSFEIDTITKKYDTIRTTFHPDSDYSTFVGAYKPTMTKVELRDVSGHVVMDGKNPVQEDRITYKFVKQAFLKAYLAAWKKYAECKDGEEVQPQFLVIEEINRGNCAQIFGDLFQLLDRQDNGFSSYPIEADADLQREIAEAFAEEGGEYQLPVDGLKLEGVVKNYKGLADKIKNGSILLLPSNLYIWATMNTSDQSLFPIDSAFKRRWDWHYVKIAKGKDKETGKDLEYKIKCGDETCDWWTFISMMNEKIAAETSSDDKKLGYFFCKPTKEGEPISVERFVSKVMFYLWNDVFKDGDTKDFNVCDDPNKTATFEAFYNDDNSVNVENVRKFLVNVVGKDALTKEDDSSSSNGKAKFLYNGTPMTLTNIVKEVVLQFGNSHPELTTAESVIAQFNELCGSFGTTVIKTENEYHELDGQASQNQNWKDVVLSNGIKLYVNTQWRGKNPQDNFMQFISVVKANNWGEITPIE